MRHVKEALSRNQLNNHPSAEPEAMTESRGYRLNRSHQMIIARTIAEQTQLQNQASNREKIRSKRIQDIQLEGTQSCWTWIESERLNPVIVVSAIEVRASMHIAR